MAAGRRAPVLAGQLLQHVCARADQNGEVVPCVDVIDRDDPALGGPGQRLVCGRGGVRVGDRHVRLRVRDPGVRDELNAGSRFGPVGSPEA